MRPGFATSVSGLKSSRRCAKYDNVDIGPSLYKLGGLLHFTLRPWKFDIGNSDYKISIQPGYVLIERPLGYEVVLSEQAAMLKEVSTFCKEAGCTKVLVLGPKTKVSLTVADIYGFGIEAAKLRLQVAVVESHDASKGDVSFLETVMWNRGSSIRFFDTEQEAKDWLAIPEMA